MGCLDGTIKTSEYRPCRVNGKNALFHRWGKSEKVVLQSKRILSREMSKEFDAICKEAMETRIIPHYMDFDIISNTVAIVEFEDGIVREVNPENVIFLDSDHQFEGYIWEER